MNAVEAKKLSQENANKNVRGIESYIKFLEGKIKGKALNGRDSVVNVWENMTMVMPTPEQLDDLTAYFQKNGYTVERNSPQNYITKISW